MVHDSVSFLGSSSLVSSSVVWSRLILWVQVHNKKKWGPSQEAMVYLWQEREGFWPGFEADSRRGTGHPTRNGLFQVETTSLFLETLDNLRGEKITAKAKFLLYDRKALCPHVNDNPATSRCSVEPPGLEWRLPAVVSGWSAPCDCVEINTHWLIWDQVREFMCWPGQRHCAEHWIIVPLFLCNWLLKVTVGHE